MRLPRFALAFLSCLGVGLFLLTSLWLLPVREPPLILSLGEYIVGNYPSGLALFQPSSGHYYANSIYDDYVLLRGVSTPLASLTNPKTSRQQPRVQTVLQSIANSWGVWQPNFHFAADELVVETQITPTSSTSATLTRTWRPKLINGAITAGVLSIKYHPQDLIIDPATKLVFMQEPNPEDVTILAGQTGQQFSVMEDVLPGTVWGISGPSVLIVQPNGAGMLELSVRANQQIIVDPANQTIQVSVELHDQPQIQILGIRTWPSHTAYDWSGNL